MSDRKAAFLDALKAEPSPVRRVVETRHRYRLAGAAFVSLAMLAVMGGPRATMRPPVLVALTASLAAVVAIVLSHLGLRRGGSMLGSPRAWLIGSAALSPFVLGLAWFAIPWSPPPPSMPQGWSADATCFALIVAMASMPLAVFITSRREGDPIRPEATGAILGAAAGAWGTVLIELHCELTLPRHVVLGHLMPIVLLAIVGAAVARSLLAVTANVSRP